MSLTHPTRRDVLKLGGAALASAFAFERTGATLAAWKKIPIGTQLWCVRKQLATDIPGTLNAIGAAGFEAVELENAFKTSGADWRKHLDAAKLKPCGFHHTLAELQGDKLAASIEFNQAIGNGNLIIRSFPAATYTSADLTKKIADAVNEVAVKVKPHNMRVGYHNHASDFNRIDGEYWWNKFADCNAGRTASMHIKPFSKKDRLAYLGKDELDWPAIMTAAESAGGIEWYIIEYELEGVPPLESLKANLDNFRKLRA
jgi:sugar phosphate isomerase/epimerase